MKALLVFRLRVALVMVLGPSAAASNWPAWRGREMTGISPETRLPVTWSDKTNVRWRVALAGPGNSSPIVWGNRVFISQAAPKTSERTLICFDRADGKLLWQSGVTYTDNEPSQENNPYCSGSPATDGERVYVCFGSAGVYAYDLQGKEVWRRDLGKLNHPFGNAVSPLLHDGLCIVNFGPDEKARLVALNKATGQTVWEAEPPKVEASEREQAGGPGGPGGPGGRRGFGPGMFVAPQMLTQADANGDGKLTQAEFTALADKWFDKLDPDQAGKLTQEQFTERLPTVLPPPQGFGPPGGGPPGGPPPGGAPQDRPPRGGPLADAEQAPPPPPPGGGGQAPGGPRPGGGGFGPGRFVGPGLFQAADVDKDGALTRAELSSTFTRWFADWDADKSGTLNEEKLRTGLNAALPRPNFGGPGGPGGGRGGPGGGMGGSWGTPIAVTVDGKAEVLATFAFRVAGFDPASGKQLWFSKGIGGSIYGTPVYGEGALVAMSSGPMGGNAVALRPGGSGELSESQRLWRQERFKSTIGSGVICQGHLFTIGQDGIAECRNLKTGERIWEERLQGPGARNSSWSSMLLVGDRIYVPNQAGDVFVLRAAPKFELIATNSVNEPTNASLAASDGDLFLRTDRGLWCFAEAK